MERLCLSRYVSVGSVARKNLAENRLWLCGGTGRAICVARIISPSERNVSAVVLKR